MLDGSTSFSKETVHSCCAGVELTRSSDASATDGSSTDGSATDRSSNDVSSNDGSSNDVSNDVSNDGSNDVSNDGSNDGPSLDGFSLDGSSNDGSSNDGSSSDGSANDGAANDGAAVRAPAIDGAAVRAPAIDGSAIRAPTIDASAIDASAIDASAIDASAIDASAIDALHARFLRRKREQSAWDAEEARDLRRADQQQIWLRYGCVTLLEYLERFCGIEPRTALERIRVSFALTDLPLLEASLEDGTFQFSHVKELSRVVVADTEEEWVRHARGLTYREVQQAVAGHSRGDRPTDPTRPDERRRCVSFRLKPSTKARMLATLGDIERARGDRFVDDDDAVNCLCDLASSALADLASSALDIACVSSGGPEAAEVTASSATEASASAASATKTSATAASAAGTFATATSATATFAAGTFATGTSAAGTSAAGTSATGAGATEASRSERTTSPRGATEASRSERTTSPRGATEASRSERATSPRGATAAIATATSTVDAAGPTSVAGAGAVRRASRRPCCAPAQVWITTDGHAFANGVELDDAERDTLLCDATIMGHVDDDSARPQPAFSARKRRRILARDMHQCRVPGCRLRHHLDVHHIIRRGDGGDHSDENLITLCSGHHRLHHGGLLQISGRAPAELIFKRVFADDEQPSRPRGREASAPRDEQTLRPRGRESSENGPPAQRMRVELAEMRRS